MSVRPSASASVTSFQLFYVSRRWRRCRRCHFLCLAFYNPPLLPLLLLLLLLRPSTFGHHKYHLGLSAMRVSGEGKGSRGTFETRSKAKTIASGLVWSCACICMALFIPLLLCYMKRAAAAAAAALHFANGAVFYLEPLLQRVHLPPRVCYVAQRSRCSF